MDKNNVFYKVKINSIEFMQKKVEIRLNPLRYYLSEETKKRLRWIYIIHYECNHNISKSAHKIGISRQWLSTLNSNWLKHNKDPRSLEPLSKKPKNVGTRKKISKNIEDSILKARKDYGWGKDKLETILSRDYKMKVGSTTINRYLSKHGLLDIKISNRIKLAQKNKKEKQKEKNRPPTILKDYQPGALMEKDMKLVLKTGPFVNYDKPKSKENFWYQHTTIDTFTRIRIIEIAEDCDSKTSVFVQKECEKRLPFKMACINTDNGGENEKYFDEYLEKNNIVHFYSRPGTPTDNPRVERSHLTDEVEFYQRGNICKNLKEQKARSAKWEYIYNYVRPHQALGNLTPIEFYVLWKKSPNKAYKIAEKWNKYLKKQSRRLAHSRKMKNREKIAKLMIQIDRKLDKYYK